MLDASDSQTIISLRLLKHTIESSRRPIVLWIGAGTSRWLGYPSWIELARSLRRHLFKYSSGFPNDEAITLIESGRLAMFFQLCKNADPKQYYRYLAESFNPRADTLEYGRFIALLERVSPNYLLTTNIDEALESRLKNLQVLQRSNLARYLDFLGGETSILAKLHGSSGAIETAVFTEEDYRSLIRHETYLHLIMHLFATCTIIFLGYGVADEYVLDLICQNTKEMSFLGAGPHFVVTAETQKTINGIHRIAYETKRHSDHRAAMTILDYIWQCRQIVSERGFLVNVGEPNVVSSKVSVSAPTAYYISDFIPPGTWQNSTAATAKHEAGMEIKLILGLGFIREELPYTQSTALHDLVVGITCFDHTYIPLLAAGPAHQTLGPDLFWRLIGADCLKFVHVENEPAVLLPTSSVFGDFGLVAIRGDDKISNRSVAEVIRRQIAPIPGKEAEAATLFSKAEAQTIIFSNGAKLEIASLVRNALLMPGISKLLGIGEAILPSQVPEWLTFPCLRLAHLVHTGALCEDLDMQAAKLPFGGVQLTTAAFGIQTASEWAESYTSWVISGDFYTDLGAYAIQNPAVFEAILKFRESAEGDAFRREVREKLLQGHGSEFTASINAGLARNIPPAAVQAARDKISVLMLADPSKTRTPAIWGTSRHSDDVTILWRRRAHGELLRLCQTRGIRKDDPCICQSGEKLRLCCLAPLRH